MYPASPQYNASIESYWSGQSMLSPSCIVEAYTAADVSTAIKILVPNNGNANLSCKFAVRSGGHTPNVNANNINDGVTIDLSNMNKTTLNADNSVASIQPGSRWRDVYNTLIPTGFQVTGGRAATVGVAGLVTGGMPLNARLRGRKPSSDLYQVEIPFTRPKLALLVTMSRIGRSVS